MQSVSIPKQQDPAVSAARSELARITSVLAVKAPQLKEVLADLTANATKLVLVQRELETTKRNAAAAGIAARDANAELAGQTAKLTEGYRAAKVQSEDAARHLVTANSEHDRLVDLNTELELTIAQREQDQTRLEREIKRLTAECDNSRVLTERADRKRIDAEAIHDQAMTAMQQRREDFRASTAAEVKKLQASTLDMQTKLEAIKQEFAEVKTEKAEWLRELNTIDQSLQIKIAAFHKERDEYIENKRLADHQARYKV